MHAAAALSEHPLATHALGECVGQLMETGGTHPDLLVLACTAPYQGALEDIVGAARQLLSPSVLVGSGAVGVLAGRREVDAHAGLAMFAWWCGGPATAGSASAPLVRGVRLGRDDVRVLDASGPGLTALAGAAGTLVLFADEFSWDPTDLLASLHAHAPGVKVVGGFVGAARHRGGNRLVLDGEQFDDGAVGVLLDPSVPVSTVLTHGTRPIGQPMTVTSAERRMVRELAGLPAVQRLHEAVALCSPEDQVLATQGALLGWIRHEDGVGASPEEVTMTSVVGADKVNGALAVTGEVPVGATVRFHVRGPTPAHEDLVARLVATGPTRGGAAGVGDGRGVVPVPGALVFTSASRGSTFFADPDHEASTVSEHVAPGAVAGVFCSSELAPVAGRNAAHVASAVVLLLG